MCYTNICGHGGIGRRARLRGVWDFLVQVQVLLSAPQKEERAQSGSFFFLWWTTGLETRTGKYMRGKKGVKKGRPMRISAIADLLRFSRELQKTGCRLGCPAGVLFCSSCPKR